MRHRCVLICGADDRTAHRLGELNDVNSQAGRADAPLLARVRCTAEAVWFAEHQPRTDVAQGGRGHWR